jgi:plastocyanin
MARSWTVRLAVAVISSQSFLPTTFAQDLSSIAGAAASASPTPTASDVSSAAASASPSWIDSSEPKVHMIKAGAGGFKFDPQEITNVSVGDIVTWEFYPPDHSVARAEYESACVPYEYTGKDKVGFWSGTQLVNNTNEVCLPKSTYHDMDDVLTSV